MEWCHPLHTTSPLTITTKVLWVHYGNSGCHLGENSLVVLTFASKMPKNPVKVILDYGLFHQTVSTNIVTLWIQSMKLTKFLKMKWST